MVKTKKILKIVITICVIALVIVPIVALSDFEEEIGENSGLTLTEAKQKIKEIANLLPHITDDNRTILNQIYKDFEKDDTIRNMYHYCRAFEFYFKYESEEGTSISDKNNKNANLKNAKATIQKIDRNYSGLFSQEIANLIDKVEKAELIKNNSNNHKPSSNKSNSSSSSKKGYSSLTSKDKDNIRKYIQDRYNYYDKLEGYYTGDKYSDSIWKEVMEMYGLTESEVNIIWMNLD